MRGMLIALAAETAASGTSLPMNATGEVYCKVIKKDATCNTYRTVVLFC